MAKLTPLEIDEIVLLYENGAGTTFLGLKFGVDHSTIYYHVEKRGVVRKVQTAPHRIDPYERARMRLERPPERHPSKGRRFQQAQTPKPAPHPYEHLLNEPVCRGKTYAEYQQEAAERERRKRFPHLYPQMA